MLKETCKETDKMSQKIDKLHNLYEHEIKIKNLYNNYIRMAKSKL